QIARTDDAQMTWPEIVDRSPVEILLDDGRADVGRARNGRRIAEPFADLAHHGGDRPLLRRLALRRRRLGELDRPDERAPPGTEVLRRELVAHMLPDVLVQLARAEVVGLAVARSGTAAGHLAKRAAPSSPSPARGRRGPCGRGPGASPGSGA